MQLNFLDQKINITLKKIIEVTNGTFNGPVESLERKVSTITIDSKNEKKCDLYIAIIGKKHDGNQFTEEAFSNGIKFAIISNPILHSKKTILVENGRTALASIASFLRKKIKPKIIAITGSNGKTTTKEVLVSIMNNYLGEDELLYTEGNFNNDIGLPLTLLNLKDSHTHAVLELGMNHAGEIAELTKIAEPHIALITNIGEAHIENFKSKDNIAEAKKELIDNSKYLETSILPRDDDYFQFLARDKKYSNQITFGFTKKATINCKVLNETTITIFTPKESTDVRINLLGRNNINNILAACACCYALDIPISVMKDGIEAVKSIPGRLEIIDSDNGAIIINDSYNANPSSMREAIDVLVSMKGTKILVIGDMAELGNNTIKYHKELGNYIKKSQIDFTFSVGIHMKITMQQLDKNGFWFDSKAALLTKLLKIIDTKSIILIKGSRFMRMEEFINKIIL